MTVRNTKGEQIVISIPQSTATVQPDHTEVAADDRNENHNSAGAYP